MASQLPCCSERKLSREDRSGPGARPQPLICKQGWRCWQRVEPSQRQRSISTFVLQWGKETINEQRVASLRPRGTRGQGDELPQTAADPHAPSLISILHPHYIRTVSLTIVEMIERHQRSTQAAQNRRVRMGVGAGGAATLRQTNKKTR
jgi:hypothetical protein